MADASHAAAVYITAQLQEGDGRAGTFDTWHQVFGLTVFALVAFRLGARFIWPTPPDVEAGWRNVVAKAIHGTLYVWLIGMPVIGWLALNAQGDSIALLGWRLPPWIGPDRNLAEGLGEIHEVGGTVGYGLIGLHAAAALFHHYILRDGLIARMLPKRA